MFVARNQRLPMDYHVVVRDAVAELVDAEPELVAEGEGPEEDEMVDEPDEPIPEKPADKAAAQPAVEAKPSNESKPASDWKPKKKVKKDYSAMLGIKKKPSLV